MLSELLRPLTGMSKVDSTKVLADYGEELLQLTYTYGYEPIRDRIDKARNAAKQAAEDEDMQRLARVAKFSGDI